MYPFNPNQGNPPQIGFNDSFGGYPPQNPGYSMPNPGYPPQNPGYPPQNPGYPVPNPGFAYPSQMQPPYNQGFASSIDYPGYQTKPSNYPPGIGGFPISPPGSSYPPQNSSNNPIMSQSSLFSNLNSIPQQNVLPQPHQNPNFLLTPQPILNPTLKPMNPFDPAEDANRLYKAMKGFGTDEKTLVDVLCRRTANQREKISLVFKTSFGKDLLKTVESETSGHFWHTLRGLIMKPSHFEAYELRDSIEGVGTNEAALIDIICAKSNQEMIQLRDAYKLLFKKNMEDEVKGDVSGYFKRVLISLMAAQRSEEAPNPQRAKTQAKELYDAGEKRFGTDEMVFNRIFCLESYAQLRLIFDEYFKLTHHDIEKALKSEMSGSVESAFLAIAKFAKNPAGYFAQRLYESMKGLGTNDKTLIRIMVLRSEIDMASIKAEFLKLYGKTLESFIKGDTSGDYKRALLCLAGDTNWK